MSAGRKAAAESDLQDRLGAELEHATRPVQALLEVPARGQRIEMLLEQAFELAPRNADQIRDPDLIYPGQIFDVPSEPEEEAAE